MREWSESFPVTTGGFEADTREFEHLLAPRDKSPSQAAVKAGAKQAEQAAADALLSDARASREIVPRHSRRAGLRPPDRTWLDVPTYRRARLLPRRTSFRELVPTQKEVRAEAAHRQGDKDGVEIDQGLFLAHALSRPRIGAHLCHAMLLPRPEIAAFAVRIRFEGLARSRRGAASPGKARLSIST